MTKYISGVIGVAAAILFLGFMAYKIAEVSYWIVTLIGIAMIVAGFVDEFLHPENSGGSASR
ncbi:MAG: hypothetical protein HY521_08775 [Proteobacteria bacterium]|nr:hypothetical protein [Pseudomonadota bacterium]